MHHDVNKSSYNLLPLTPAFPKGLVIRTIKNKWNKCELFFKSDQCCSRSLISDPNRSDFKKKQNFASAIDRRQPHKAPLLHLAGKRNSNLIGLEDMGCHFRIPPGLWHRFHRSQSKRANGEREGATYSKWQKQLMGSAVILQIINEWPHSQSVTFPCLREPPSDLPATAFLQPSLRGLCNSARSMQSRGCPQSRER